MGSGQSTKLSPLLEHRGIGRAGPGRVHQRVCAGPWGRGRPAREPWLRQGAGHWNQCAGTRGHLGFQMPSLLEKPDPSLLLRTQRGRMVMTKSGHLVLTDQGSVEVLGLLPWKHSCPDVQRAQEDPGGGVRGGELTNHVLACLSIPLSLQSLHVGPHELCKANMLILMGQPNFLPQGLSSHPTASPFACT